MPRRTKSSIPVAARSAAFTEAILERIRNCAQEIVVTVGDHATAWAHIRQHLGFATEDALTQTKFSMRKADVGKKRR